MQRATRLRTRGRIRQLLTALLIAFAAGSARADARRAVTFGVQLAPENTTVEQMVSTAQLVERLGYDSLWLNDHFIPIMGDKDAAHFESWILLTALAVQTQRIRLGILVSGNTSGIRPSWPRWRRPSTTSVAGG